MNSYNATWWRHQMETFSALLALCAGNSAVTGEFPSQRPVTRSFDVFFDLRLNKRFSKQSWDWWFEAPSCPLWHHCNVWGKKRNYSWDKVPNPQYTSARLHSSCLIYPLKCGDRINAVQHCQYHGCWCPGSLRRQDISTHDTDYVE